VVFVTAAFWPQGDFVAEAEGMPGIPRIRLPHPVAGIGRAAMEALAEDVRGEVLRRLADG
jgi:hypothetical protein